MNKRKIRNIPSISEAQSYPFFNTRYNKAVELL